MPEHNSPVEIAVLGPLLVRVDGIERPVSAAKQRLLLVRLAIDAGVTLSSDRLIDALWGSRPPATAAKNLQVLIGRLRTVLGTAALVTEPGGYRIDADACWIDAVEFEQLVTDAQGACDEPGGDAVAMRLLANALGCWRGDVAHELDSTWGAPRAARWTELRHVAHERLLAVRVEHDRSPELVAELRSLVARRPHQESLRVLLVDALRRLGDLPAARIALDEAVTELASELGLVPSAGLAAIAAEFGVAIGPASTEETAPPFEIVKAIAAFGDRFHVGDVLAAAPSDEYGATMLDELEAMVERGELLRAFEQDGRVVLTRCTPDHSGEVAQ